MKNKKFLVGAISAAMVASVVTPVAAPVDAASAAISIVKVQVLKAESVKVTYKKSRKTVTTTIKPVSPVKHLAQLVVFKIDNQTYRYKLARKFQNPNYVSYGKQVAKAKAALADNDVDTANEATAAAYRHFKLIKTSYMSPSTYEKAYDTLSALEEQIERLEASIEKPPVKPPVKEETKVASVQSVQFDSPTSLTISGSNLDKLSSGNITVTGISVTSASANAAGTSMTVQLGSALALGKSTNVAIRIDGTTKNYTVMNNVEAKTVSVQAKTYDYNTSSQYLTLAVDGNEMSVDTLKSYGYSVTFTSYNSGGNILDSGLFSGNSSTSSTGLLDSSIVNHTTFQVMVSIVKNGKTISSGKTSIYIKDLYNRNSNIRMDIVTGWNQSSDNYLTVGDYTDNTVRYRLTTYSSYGTTGTVNTSNYRIYSSNTSVASVSSSGTDVVVTAVGAGTATIYVYDLSNKLITSQTVTVSGTYGTVTNQTQANQMLNTGATNVTLPLSYSGDLNITTNSYQNITLTGNITGSVTVNAPNATITNAATIGGNVNIQNASITGFVNNGTISGGVYITDGNGVGFSNSGYVTGGVALNTAGAVYLSGNSNYNVVARTNNSLISKTGSGANVTAAAGVTAYVNGILISPQTTVNATGNITFSSPVATSKQLPVGYITVTDSNANTDINVVETITVNVAGASYILTETGANTGIFRNMSTIDLTRIADGTRVTVTYYDQVNAAGIAELITNNFTLPSTAWVSPVTATAIDTSLTIDTTGTMPSDDVSATIRVPGLKSYGLSINDLIITGLPTGLTLTPSQVGENIYLTLSGYAYVPVTADQTPITVIVKPSALTNSTNKTNSAPVYITLTKKTAYIPAAPNAVGGPGQITGLIPNATYEYCRTGTGLWTPVVAVGGVINGVPMGTYDIRLSKTATSEASASTTVTVYAL